MKKSPDDLFCFLGVCGVSPTKEKKIKSRIQVFVFVRTITRHRCQSAGSTSYFLLHTILNYTRLPKLENGRALESRFSLLVDEIRGIFPDNLHK